MKMIVEAEKRELTKALNFCLIHSNKPYCGGGSTLTNN